MLVVHLQSQNLSAHEVAWLSSSNVQQVPITKAQTNKHELLNPSICQRLDDTPSISTNVPRLLCT